jgi:hypothetical protein
MQPSDATQQAPAADAKPKAVDPDLLRQIVEEMEVANPYGFGKYDDEDATVLGLPSLGSLRLAHRLSREWANTAYIPKWIQESQNPIGTFVATVVRGNELGMKMMESLSALYLSPDGRLGIMGTAMLGLMRKAKISLTFTEMEDEETREIYGVKVFGKRQDGDTYTSVFTHEDAITAGLWDKNKSIHQKYPIWMMKWRAVADVFRTLASDLSGGPAYTAEELREDAKTDRGDSSNGAFREEAERQTNQYHVGKLSDQVSAESVKPNGSAMDVKLSQETSTQAAPEKGEDKPQPAATEKSASTSPQVSNAELEKAYQQANAGKDHQKANVDQAGVLREELGKALDLAPPPPDAAPVKMVNIEVPKTNVVEMPKASPVLDSKPAAMTSEQVKKAWTDMAVEFLPAVSPESLARKAFPDFTRGFLNIGKLPTSSDQYPACIAILKSILKSYKAQFNQSPSGMGAMAGASWTALRRYAQAANWPDDIRDLVYSIAIERYPYAEESDTGSYMIDYLNDPAHIEMLDEAELRMFLVIMMKTPKAMLLQEMSVATSRSMVDIVMSWGVDLEKATEAEILALLSTPPPAANEDAQQQEATAVVEPAAGPDEFDDLFSDLEDEPNAPA